MGPGAQHRGSSLGGSGLGGSVAVAHRQGKNEELLVNFGCPVIHVDVTRELHDAGSVLLEASDHHARVLLGQLPFGDVVRSALTA